MQLQNYHEDYKRRLIQLGENPKTIFNYGGLGAHSIAKSKFKSKSELERLLKIDLSGKVILVTFHPVTLEKNKSEFQIKNLIRFLNNLDNVKILITSNFDNENEIIKKELLKFSEKKMFTI